MHLTFVFLAALPLTLGLPVDSRATPTGPTLNLTPDQTQTLACLCEAFSIAGFLTNIPGAGGISLQAICAAYPAGTCKSITTPLPVTTRDLGSSIAIRGLHSEIERSPAGSDAPAVNLTPEQIQALPCVCGALGDLSNSLPTSALSILQSLCAAYPGGSCSTTSSSDQGISLPISGLTPTSALGNVGSLGNVASGLGGGVLARGEEKRQAGGLTTIVSGLAGGLVPGGAGGSPVTSTVTGLVGSLTGGLGGGSNALSGVTGGLAGGILA